MTPEGKVKAAVKKYLQAQGVWFWMPVSNGMGQVGIPDFICCYNGTFLAIETKAPGKLSNVTANQQRVIDEIKTHGGLALVVDSVDSLIPTIEYLKGDHP
ncbi:MAG: VRR-NUC domain-containing protein [Inhella sp.]|jgi:hypothetical protein